MNRKAIISAALSLALCAGMSVSTHAANPNAMRIMEENSRRAVAAAISAGIIPPDSTIYDCAYGEGANGATVVVRYKDDNGVWIDVTTGKAIADSPQTTGVPAVSVPVDSASKPDELTQEQYAAEVFRLVNAERRKAGLAEVAWDDEFAACAQIRAAELVVKYSHERPESVNDGIDWPQNTSGKGIYNAPSVADEQGEPHEWIMENIAKTGGGAERVMELWMDSAGHRRNILKESHVRCGVGVVIHDGVRHWALWFDDYAK